MLAENPCPRVVQCGATDLPFPDGSFDVAFEANLLHHVEDRTKVVREMARVSRRWVVLIEPNRYNPLMLAFGLVVPAERGLLTSTKASNLAIVREVGLKPISWMTTGMISQNNTPSVLLPIQALRSGDLVWGVRDFNCGKTIRGKKQQCGAAPLKRL
jgi:SAM-dependent methyltransferase